MKTKTDQTKVETVLAEAQRIIDGPRRDSYGPADASFQRIAAVWNQILFDRLTKPITARHVAQMMMGLKLCRDANRTSRDNLVDIAGYAGLAEHLS